MIVGGMLLLAACGSRLDRNQSTRTQSDAARAASAVENTADNMASAEYKRRDYTMFEPTLQPSLASPANLLTKPAAYRAAIFGYFDDPDIQRQFTPKERAQMPVNGNAFHASADLDYDGAVETYRTGYYAMPDGAIGVFLVAFEHGKQIGLWTEPDPGRDILWIWTRDGLSLSHCNCPETGTISLKRKQLRVSFRFDYPTGSIPG